MNEQDKRELINFYRRNSILWKSDDSDHNNKERRLEVKENLSVLFKGKYTIETLEKTFHSLRTCMNREIKKEIDGNPPKKKWKFYDDLEFLKTELSAPKKKLNFEEFDVETLIDFYQSNPPLWNHNLAEYRDRDLRDVLLGKCVEEFDGRYNKEEIKQQWHNLLTTYKREYQRQEASKTSGSDTRDVYSSNWEYFNNMTFVEATCNVDESFNTLDEIVIPPKKKKTEQKFNKINPEQSAKADLWQAIANSLNSQVKTAPNVQNQVMQGSGSSLCERAQLFGRTVADSLMQCDANDWPMLKKKIMDLFYDYEQQRRNHSGAGFNFSMHSHNTPTHPTLPTQQSFTNMLQMPYSPFNVSSPSNESYTS